IGVSFLPVLTLEGQEGRLFTPLAYTKSLCMVVAGVLAITLDPALRLLLIRVRRFDFRPAWICRATNAVAVGTIHSEEKHPISRRLIRAYEPIANWSLRRPWIVVGIAVAALIATVPVYQRLGSEFMPPLDEGTIFYMPSTMPGISIANAEKLLRSSDRISQEQLVRELDEAVDIPGLSNAWTMPVRARTGMLTTGIRTPIGLKISGGDVAVIDALGAKAEAILSRVPGARRVFAERTGAGLFLDITWNREQIARYGLSIDDAQTIVQNAIGGENVTTTIEGRER